MDKSKVNSQSENTRRLPVLLLFVITSIGGLLLIWVANKSKPKTEKQT